MKFLFASDSFKGTLSSKRTAELLAQAASEIFPGCEYSSIEVADGGEGTTDAVLSAVNGEKIAVSVHGPLWEEISAYYGKLDDRRAVMEMAAASGLPLVPSEQRDPRKTTSYGTGEMIADALGKGFRDISIAIGGSATNDGGIGCMRALGVRFLDENGQELSGCGADLAEIRSIDVSGLDPRVKECKFTVMCDVTNPLCGPQGCSAVYGPQKGADEEMIARMDKWMEAYGALTEAKYPGIDSKTPGCGAAGGIGFAFYAFLHGSLESGIKIVLEETRLADYVKDADIVVTGEGRLDGQTVMGKAPIGVARTAKQYGKKVIAFSGSVTKDAIACNAGGIDAFFSIFRRIVTLEEAMDPQTARENMTDTSEQVFRLLRACRI